jgi:hypothetical protein
VKKKPACSGCAAVWAAQQLFPMVEDFGVRHDMGPDAMQAALIELLALWVCVNAEYQQSGGDIAAPVDSVLLASVTEYAAAVRIRADRLPVSDDFRAATNALPGHRH